MIKAGLFFAASLGLSACSTVSETVSVPPSNHVPCFSAFEALDELASQSAGTLVANRISTMPWLRYDRLVLHDLRPQSTTTDIKKVLKRMSLLASQGLTYELAATPINKIEQWQERYQVSTSNGVFVKQCSDQLIKEQLQSSSKTLADLKAIPVDNDYSTLARVAGLYPLATIPFRLGVVKEQRQLAKEWGQISGRQWAKYQPVAGGSSSTLLNRHAPTWFIDSNTRANLPGTPQWQGKQLKVNTQQASTYAFVSKARWKQQAVTQLNYIIWFSERPPLKRFDWVAGQHDAVVFRVNLNQRDEVIAYDSIHLCGCWYRLFLPEGRPFKSNNRYWREPVLMQRIRKSNNANPRMAVYLQADTHQIQYVQPTTETKTATRRKTTNKHYQLKPFTELMMLPTAEGVRSVFSRSGYVAGSERPERWLFWPMGVRNPGALRRFGDHAISFVGRRYFDDPRLLEKVSGLPTVEPSFVRAK